MAISTNIDGTVGSSNQLLDLLSVVSNPKVYESKIQDLQDATDAYNKAIALAGPADEIVDLRAKAKDDRDAAKAELADAKAKASKAIADANAQANNIVLDATNKANVILSDAKNKQAETDKLQANVVAAQADIQKLQAAADKLNATAQKKLDDAADLLAKAKDAQKQADADKAAVIAKHKAFIESL
jgi:chromosome segregation ATPase